MLCSFRMWVTMALHNLLSLVAFTNVCPFAKPCTPPCSAIHSHNFVSCPHYISVHLPFDVLWVSSSLSSPFSCSRNFGCLFLILCLFHFFFPLKIHPHFGFGYVEKHLLCKRRFPTYDSILFFLIRYMFQYNVHSL